MKKKQNVTIQKNVIQSNQLLINPLNFLKV